jgi:hypothetical protein
LKAKCNPDSSLTCTLFENAQASTNSAPERSPMDLQNRLKHRISRTTGKL